MMKVYEDTDLTPIKVAKMSGYIDWSSQPSSFKHYPNFLFRYKYEENQLLRAVELCRIITSRTSIGVKPYYQLNTPSAGNLHPVELYVQIRGVKGILSGIYHVDAGASEIVLIKEIGYAGIEPYVGLNKQLTGMIFLVSCVPYRAQWKYFKRSMRYCYLDVGHQIGSIFSSMKLHRQNRTILSDFDIGTLNNFMGFKGEEFITAVFSSGKSRDSNVEKFKEKLMYVTPTDYSELYEYLAENISTNEILKSDVSGSTANLKEVNILNRRSTRYFSADGLSKIKINYILECINIVNYSIYCYNIILKDTYKKAGIYIGNTLLKEGYFADKISALLVDQSFVKNGDIITIITSKHFSANKLMQAGAFAHNLYMEAEVQNIGFSGIGAFYDKKLQDFLAIDDYILYVCVTGEEQK